MSSRKRMSRRDFLRTSTLMGAGLLATQCAPAAAPAEGPAPEATEAGGSDQRQERSRPSNQHLPQHIQLRPVTVWRQAVDQQNQAPILFDRLLQPRGALRPRPTH